jgi:hypothetical protein
MDSHDRVIRQRFAAYRGEVTDEVRAPGIEDVHRVVFRRQRRRTAAVGVACAILVGLVVGQFLTRQPTPTNPSGAVSPSPSAEPGGQSPSSAGSPSGTPSSSPPHSQPPSSSSSRPPTDPGPSRRTYPIVDGSELHVVALKTVTLQPDGDTYRGSVDIDVYDSGRQPHEYTRIYIGLPAGIQWDSTLGNPTSGGCGGATPPETWTCPGEPVPAMGGYRRLTFYLRANIKPGASTLTVNGFSVRVDAVGQAGTVLPDATPADNKAVVSLRLPPA